MCAVTYLVGGGAWRRPWRPAGIPVAGGMCVGRRAPLLAAAALLLLLLARLPPAPPDRPQPAAVVVSSSKAASPDPPPAAPPSAPAKPAAHTTMTQDKGKERVMLIKEVMVSGHRVPHPELCPRLGAGLALLVLVTSAPAHAPARDAVRLTWGAFAKRADVALGFLIGITPSNLQESIAREDALYGDIIQGNWVDSYSNLTLKTLSMLEWSTTYCPRAPRLLKTDDDVFINVPRLLRFLADPARRNATRTIWGRVHKKALPNRNPAHKYYLSRVQFPNSVLPTYAAGPAYVMTSDCIIPLLAAAPAARFIRIEDVFVTGVLADQIGLVREHSAEFHNNLMMMPAHPCAVQRGMSIHTGHDTQFDLWHKLLAGRTTCS